jgi:hypothetical protein
MTSFRKILRASAEELVNLFYKVTFDDLQTRADRIRKTAEPLGLTPSQLICALGFNPAMRTLDEIVTLLGYGSYDDLAKSRNEVFIKDAYDKLPVDDVLSVYTVVKHDPDFLQLMQYLLRNRIGNIEKRIETTVNSHFIERYKKEMRAIYSDGIAQIEFAESRLDQTHSGFRALINEVAIIVESKLIPVGDIFFRNTVLPEEKRKIVNRCNIPRELIHSRLDDDTISIKEREILQDYLESSK